MPHCPSYEEMDALDNELKKCALIMAITNTEAQLMMAIIADNKQMRKHLDKLGNELKLIRMTPGALAGKMK